MSAYNGVEAEAPTTPNVTDGNKVDMSLKEKNEYYGNRIQLFERFYERQQKDVLKAKEQNLSLTVTLPDQNTKSAVINLNM